MFDGKLCGCCGQQIHPWSVSVTWDNNVFVLFCDFPGLPWLWGFMLGFVLSAVSPAVVVPCLLSLQSRGLGVNKGMSNLQQWRAFLGV